MYSYIDFREWRDRDDQTIKHAVREVYQTIHKSAQGIEDILSAIERFRGVIQSHYRGRVEYSPRERGIRADEVFSQFCQNIIYYTQHNTQREDKDTLFSHIIQLHGFIYTSTFDQNRSPQVILWQDPKEGMTALHPLARGGYVESMAMLLSAVKDVLAVIHNPAFFSYINSRDKDGFTPLNTAASHGHAGVVKVLLENAGSTLSTDEFQAFLTRANASGFTPLNSAAQGGHDDVVRILLQYAEEAFGGITTRGFQRFLTHVDNKGYSVLHSAVSGKNVEMLWELIDAARKAFGRCDSTELQQFLGLRAQDTYTVFDLAQGQRDRDQQIIDILNTLPHGSFSGGFFAPAGTGQFRGTKTRGGETGVKRPGGASEVRGSLFLREAGIRKRGCPPPPPPRRIPLKR